MRTQEQTRAVDLRLAEVVEGQHGVVGRSQLEDLGLKPGAVGRRLRAGRLHRLYPGVYAVGHRVLSNEARWMAAVLASGAGAVLSYRSAAAMWRIRDAGSATIDITSPGKTASRGAIRRHCAHLPADEVTIENGIPVTTVPRTIFDLAAVSRPEAVESALRQSEYLRLFDPLSLWDFVERYPGHRGIRSVRAALARRSESSGRTIGRFEERFTAFLDRHQLPRPQFNAWIELPDHRFQVDCLWPEPMEIVELDSWEAHGTQSAFQSDKSRDRTLRVAGYHVTRVTWRQLDNEPKPLAADLRTLLTRQVGPLTATTPADGLR
jgi:very-short-patch-repair endonuclease